MKKILDYIAIVAMIIVSIGVFYFMLWPQIQRRWPDMIEKGDTVKIQDFTPKDGMLVAMVAPGCVHCENMYPFFRSLYNAGHLQLIVPRTPPDGYYAERGFLQTFVGDFRGMKIPGTPTLVRVDGNGAVTRIWRGELTADQQSEVVGLFQGEIK